MTTPGLQESSIYCPYCGESIEVLLNPEDVPVIYELQECYETWKNKVKVNKPKYFGDKISKEFRHINRLVGFTNKLHDLMHTYAVRRYLMI